MLAEIRWAGCCRADHHSSRAVAAGFHDDHAANRGRIHNRGKVVRPEFHGNEAQLATHVLKVVAWSRRVQFDQDNVTGLKALAASVIALAEP